MMEEKLTLGFERLRSDRRQLGGMLLVMGVCVTFQPLAGIASLIGFNSDASGTAFDDIWLICCAIIQMIFGTLAMVVGYLSLVHDYGNRRLTGTLLLITQLSWIPFITGIIQVGVAASPPYIIQTRRSWSDGIALLEEYVVNPFVPENYLPNKNDVLFLGCMGILGLISYGVGFFGSLTFLEFSLYKFDAGKPTEHDVKYYRGLLLFFSFDILIAGMSQILFGAYVLFEFGGGRLSPSVGVAMYRVSFPEISVAVGSIQMLVGYHGIGNYLHFFPVGPNNNNFQILALIGWLLQLILQYIVQICYIEGNDNSAELSSLALYSFALYSFPPFLDYKMRTNPTPLNIYYYGTIKRDNKIGVDVRADLPSREKSTSSVCCEKVSLAENLKTLEIHSGSDDNSEFDRESSDGAGSQRQNVHNNDSKPETLPKDIKNKRTSGQSQKRVIFPRFFLSLQERILDRGGKLENKQARRIEQKNVDRIPNQTLNKWSNESGTVVEEIIRNPYRSNITLEETMKNRDATKDAYRPSPECPDDPGIKVEVTIDHSSEPGITVEETIEYPIDSGIIVEQPVEYSDNSGAHLNDAEGGFLEPGITVEEYVEYPDLSREKTFKKTKMERVRDDNDSDDQDTPPRSNESFITDMEDTWGDQSRQQILLSSIEEEDSHRMQFKGGQESSSSREPINLPRDFDSQDRDQEKEISRSKIFEHASNPIMDPSIPDSYYDYDTDEGYEISEATPDDDTAALDAKIEKLKGDLISDTSLESYLNQIL